MDKNEIKAIKGEDIAIKHLHQELSILRNKIEDLEISNNMLKASALNKEVTELRKQIKELQEALNIAFKLNNELRSKIKYGNRTRKALEQDSNN